MSVSQRPGKARTRSDKVKARRHTHPRPRGSKWGATAEDPSGSWYSHMSRSNRRQRTKATGKR